MKVPKQELLSEEEAVRVIMERTGKNFQQARADFIHNIAGGRLKPFDHEGNEVPLDALFPQKAVEFVPTIRMRCIGDDGTDYGDLRAILDWWDTLPETEVAEMWERHLNKHECKRLWKYLGRTDKPPRRLAIALNRDDLKKRMPGVEWK